MSLENPTTFLFNTEGYELAVSASQLLDVSGTQPGIVVAGSGSDGTVHFMKVANDGAVFITGSVNATATMAPNTPVSQGLAGAIPDSWYVRITDGTQVIGTGSSAPVWVTGAVDVKNPVIITDGGGSITVDGTVAVSSVGGTVTVGGTVAVSNFPATQSVSVDAVTVTLPVSVSNFPAVQVITGSVAVDFNPSTSATVTSVSSSTSPVTIQAANGARRGLMVYNLSTKNLFLKLGAGATTSIFSVKLAAQGYFEVPGDYTGLVTGVWDAVNGAALVTEILD